MRRDSRCAIWFRIASFGAVLLVANVGWGQITQTYQPLAHDAQNSTEPSPLSQFATVPLVKEMGRVHFPLPTGGAVGVVPQGPIQLNEANSRMLVTKEVDLKNTLRKYAAFKKCSLNEAFSETVSFLKMVPLHDKNKAPMVGAQAIYSIVKQDIYRISAPQKFFDALPLNLLCIENGKRNLLLEIHFLGVPSENPEAFKSMMVPGSFLSFNNKIPQATPYATAATYKNESARDGLLSQPQGTFVAATETRTKVYPTFMGRLNDEGVTKLLSTVKANQEFKVTMNSSVVISPGQTATVADASSRPFVVGMNRIEGDFALAHQPIVQPVEEGTFLVLRAVGDQGKIRLDADLALSEIESVETFGYSDLRHIGAQAGQEKSATPVTVQIPEQRLKQVHFSTLVEEGHTVFIDPVFIRKFETRLDKRMNKHNATLNPKGNAESKSAESRVMLMIKPRWVEIN